MTEFTLFALPLLLAVSLSTSSATDDTYEGTYIGQHWSGPVFIEVRALDEGYVLRFSSMGSEPLEAEAAIDGEGVLRGAFTFRMLGFRRSDDFALRRQEGGFHFRTKGVNVDVEQHHLADNDPRSEEWAQALAGRRILYTGSDGSTGGSGSHFSSERGQAELCPDGRFDYAFRSSFSANVPGMSAHSDDQDGGQGLWRVLHHMGQPVLELRFFDGRQMYFQLAPHPEGIMIDGRRCFVQPAQGCW